SALPDLPHIHRNFRLFRGFHSGDARVFPLRALQRPATKGNKKSSLPSAIHAAATVRAAIHLRRHLQEKAMQRHPRIVSVVVVGVILWGGLAHAQFRGGGAAGGFGMGGQRIGGLVMLAGADAGQKDLELGGDAADKVKKIVDAYRQGIDEMMADAGAGFGRAFQELQSLPPTERAAKERDMQEKAAAKSAETIKKLNDKFVPQLKDALSASQFERLQQINWQASG